MIEVDILLAVLHVKDNTEVPLCVSCGLGLLIQGTSASLYCFSRRGSTYM